MKRLLDSCVWGGAKFDLEALGHDVVWCGDWDHDPGDEAVLAIARNENRVPVTLDKDFGELAVVREQPHRGLLRLVGFRARQQAQACQSALTHYGDELLAGAIVTANPRQIRLRPA